MRVSSCVAGVASAGARVLSLVVIGGALESQADKLLSNKMTLKEEKIGKDKCCDMV